MVRSGTGAAMEQQQPQEELSQVQELQEGQEVQELQKVEEVEEVQEVQLGEFDDVEIVCETGSNMEQRLQKVSLQDHDYSEVSLLVSVCCVHVCRTVFTSDEDR